jgi:hypothetical protein
MNQTQRTTERERERHCIQNTCVCVGELVRKTSTLERSSGDVRTQIRRGSQQSRQRARSNSMSQCTGRVGKCSFVIEASMEGCDTRFQQYTPSYCSRGVEGIVEHERLALPGRVGTHGRFGFDSKLVFQGSTLCTSWIIPRRYVRDNQT